VDHIAVGALLRIASRAAHAHRASPRQAGGDAARVQAQMARRRLLSRGRSWVAGRPSPIVFCLIICRNSIHPSFYLPSCSLLRRRPKNFILLILSPSFRRPLFAGDVCLRRGNAALAAGRADMHMCIILLHIHELFILFVLVLL